MKYLLFSTFIAVITSTVLYGQAPKAGKITYEVMRQVDLSQVRMVVNGQEMRPGGAGSPDMPEGMPDVISFTQKLIFSGTMAKEERDRQPNTMRQTRDGTSAAGGPR